MSLKIARAGSRALLLIVSALPLGAAADEGDLAARRADAVKALIDDLEEVAHFANREKLYASRNQIYESILVLDSEHREARTRLGHKRDASGWIVPEESGASVKDFPGGSQEGLRKRLGEAAASGAPLEPAIRAYIDGERRHRHTGAIERARRLPVRLMIPMTLLVLPGFVVMVYGPAVVALVADLIGPLAP